MNKIYHKPGMPFLEMMEMLMTPGQIKPRVATFGFTGVEVRSFFRIEHPEKITYKR